MRLMMNLFSFKGDVYFVQVLTVPWRPAEKCVGLLCIHKDDPVGPVCMEGQDAADCGRSPPCPHGNPPHNVLEWLPSLGKSYGSCPDHTWWSAGEFAAWILMVQIQIHLSWGKAWASEV